MKFDTGRFLIKNADSGNLAVLPDANQGTDLVGAILGLDDNLKGEKWNIVLLSSKKFNKYKIQNFDFAGYASCDTRPDPGHSVRGKTSARQWTIKESNRAGHYTISTGNDPELFWGLPDDEDGTPVELSDKGSDPHNQWTFERVSDLDDCMRDMKGDSRSQCLKALNDFSSLAATQLDVAIQDGGLATVINLLSHSDTVIQSTASTALTTLALTVFPQIIVDLYGWKSAMNQTRALQKIIHFAIVDQIKAAAVESYVIPHLVKLLESKEAAVVGKSLEVLNVLMSIPVARTAAYEAQAGPVLQQLVASDSSSKGAAEAVLALVGASDPASPPASPPASVLSSPEAFMTPHRSPTLSTDLPESAKRQPKRSNTLGPPMDSDTTPSTPTNYTADTSVNSISAGAAFVDQGSSDLAMLRRGSVPTPGLSEGGDMTVPIDASIPSLVAFLQGRDFATWGAAARGLRNATQDDANAQNLAFALGAVPALAKILVADLSNTLVAGYVVEALSNIVVLNDEAKVSAIESGVLPSLVQLLYNSTICGRAVMTLRFLSRNALGQLASEGAGAVPALVRLLDEREEVTTRINAAAALSNISMDESVKQAVWEAGPLPHLLRMLDSPDTSLHPMSTGALWSLSRYVKARVDIGTHVARFGELLGSDQSMVRVNAAGVLSNICAEINLKEAAIKAGVIPPLVQLIQSTDDLNALNNGVSSLWGLSILPIVHSDLALSGCVPALVKFLESDDLTLRSNSAITLWCIANCKEGQKGIVDARGIPPLVRLLSDKDKVVQNRAAGTIWNITPLDTAVRKELIRAGCLPALIRLVDSDHIPSRMPAAAALWNLFFEGEAQRMGIELKAIPALLKLMVNAEMDWPTRTKAAGALRVISFPQDGKIAVAAAGGIVGLISCLDPEKKAALNETHTAEDRAKKEKEEETSRYAFVFQVCGAMWNVTVPSENQIQALTLGAIPKLIALLQNPSPQLCGQAAGALANVTCIWNAKAASQGCIPALVNLLQLDAEHIDVKAQAARCLTNITGDYTLKQYAAPAVPGLVMLLQSNNAVAVNQAALAIKSIVSNSSVKSVARANGVVEVLKRLVSQHASDTNVDLKENLESALSSMSKIHFW